MYLLNVLHSLYSLNGRLGGSAHSTGWKDAEDWEILHVYIPALFISAQKFNLLSAVLTGGVIGDCIISEVTLYLRDRSDIIEHQIEEVVVHSALNCHTLPCIMPHIWGNSIPPGWIWYHRLSDRRSCGAFCSQLPYPTYLVSCLANLSAQPHCDWAYFTILLHLISELSLSILVTWLDWWGTICNDAYSVLTPLFMMSL